MNHNTAVLYPTSNGHHVRSGMRQSIPSSSIESWAAMIWILSSAACGQTKRPRSKRLVKRQVLPVNWLLPSRQIILSESSRRPRKTNRCCENGSCSSWFSQSAASEFKPLRMSVTPAPIQTRAPEGSANIRQVSVKHGQAH